MDRGAWPFFVDGVTCLVNSVSVNEEKRGERREERRSRGQEKRRAIEKRNERKDNFFKKKKNVSRPSNPPDELAQNVSKKKKIPFGRIIPPFFYKSSESGRFSFIYMIRIRFFGPGELIQNYFRAAQYWSIQE